MALGDNAPEIGRDALDPREPPPRWLQWFPSRHLALGLRPSAAPSLTFILAGLILGPHGLGALDVDALAHLDAVVSVALAALGVFVGLALGALRLPALPGLLLPVTTQVLLTILVVGGGFYGLFVRWALPLPLDGLLFAAALGVCASASAAARLPGGADAERAARIVDLDDLPLILLGGIAVAVAGGRPVASGLLINAVVSILVATAGWLLFDRARTPAERGVFVTGTVLLLGGVGAQTGTSPLLSGAFAALVWTRAAGAADRIIADDLGRLQHPLVALLLVVAGASIEWSAALVWIAAPLVLLRLIGKLLGAAAVARQTGLPAGLLATVLVPPGVLGVGLALNLQQVLGDAGTLLLSAVTAAVVASELLAALVPADEEAAA